MWIRTESASGALLRRSADFGSPGAATRIFSKRASIWRACTWKANSLDPESVSYKSSAISAIDGWKSPVLLVQGDDDRNVSFLQTVGLVQLLRQRNVYYELIVFRGRRARIATAQPVDLYSRTGPWITFLHKFLWELPASTTTSPAH